MVETDLSAVSYIREFGNTLENMSVDRHEVCLFGSTTLALYGLRSNHDIDFIATPSVREKIHQFARRDPNSKIIKGVRTHVGEHFELLVPDRLDSPPYEFNLDDETIIRDPEYHVSVDGFRFIRPELILSMKAAKRRPKDIKDIKRIQESGLTEMNQWNWEYVFVVPPWERRFTTQKSGVRGRIERSAPYRALEILLSQGPRAMFGKTANFLKPKLQSFYRRSDLLPIALARTYYQGQRFKRTVTEDLEFRYPLPNLLGRQYDEDAQFERYNLVERLLDVEGAEAFTSVDTDSTLSSEVVVSPDGKLIAGVDVLAQKLTEWSDDLPIAAPKKTVPVNIARSEQPQLATLDGWRDDEQLTERLRDRKRQLLRQSGTAFYAILWPKVRELFDEIEELVASNVSIIDEYEYEIPEFEAFIRDVYDADKRNTDWFRDNKIAELQRFDPVVRVLVLEIPNPDFGIKSGHPVCNQGYDLKMSCRKEIQQLLDDYVYGTAIHVTDNFQHNAHFGHLLREVENGVYSGSRSTQVNS